MCNCTPLVNHVMVQKLDKFQIQLISKQNTSKKMDDARYKILRVCTMQLTYWVCMKIHQDLMAMDNHSYDSCDDHDNYYVLHRRKYQFCITLMNGRWCCYAPEGRRCWRNCRLGRPCQHILLVWCHLLRTNPKSFNLNSIPLSFNKVYRRSHYMVLREDSYRQVPPAPEPVRLSGSQVDQSVELRKTKKLLDYMVASADGNGDFLLSCLRNIINRLVYELLRGVLFCAHPPYFFFGVCMHAVCTQRLLMSRMHVCSKMQGKAATDPDVQQMFASFMAPTPGSLTAQPQQPTPVPRYVADPRYKRDNRSTERRRRFDNHSFSGDRMGLDVLTLREKAASARQPKRPILKHASMRNFIKDGHFKTHVTYYIDILFPSSKLQQIINMHFSKRPLFLAVDFEWEANYEPKDHPKHPTGPYRCYGVDVGIYSTGECTLVVHHAQFNEKRWCRPGPYRAKAKKRPEVG